MSLCSSCRYFACLSRYYRRSQQPRGLKRRSTAARLLRLWVRIPPGAWMSVCCGCCMLSGRGLCDELITRPEESYRLWRFIVCDLETSWMKPWPTTAVVAKANKADIISGTFIILTIYDVTDLYKLYCRCNIFFFNNKVIICALPWRDVLF